MKEITPLQIKENPVQLFAKDWALLTAGNIHDFNTMTISWGMLGNLWGMPIAICYVRPQRYTHLFIERCKHYTLAFFEPEMKQILSVMGTKSGRDIDKMHYPGLTAMELPSGLVGFEEAKLIIECGTVYSDVLKEAHFLDKRLIERWYPERDFHTTYAASITHVWEKE